MDHTVERLSTPEECEQYAQNVLAKYPELAKEARRREVILLAETHGEVSEAEFEALQAIHAYEQACRRENGRKGSGLRPWPSVKKLGILAALEKLAGDRKLSSVGNANLLANGMSDLTYEAVIDKHAASFSPGAVTAARKRLSVAEQKEAAAVAG